MRRFFSFAAAVLVLASPTLANAGILSGGITTNGIVDTLNDNSAGLIKDIDSSNSLSIGDIVQGVIQIDKIVPDGGALPDVNTLGKLYAVYSFEVGSVNGSVFDFKVASGAYSLQSLLGGAGFSTAGMQSTLAGTLADATIAVFETSANASLSSFTANTGFTNGAGAIGGQISAANGWILDVVTGLVGDDFFQIDLLRTNNLTTINSSTTNSTLADYATAQSALFHNLGSWAFFLPLTADKLDGSGQAFGDLVSSGNNAFSLIKPVTGTNNDSRDRGWTFEDRGNFDINVVPEPTSMIAFSSLGLIFAAAARRRRRKE